jgi:hypothetical protein
MVRIVSGANFSPFQPKIFELLEKGTTDVEAAEYFLYFLVRNANRLIEKYGLEVIVSKLRVGDAQAFWLRDIERLDVDGSDPNHFKRAGFLAFWLRRRVIVERSICLRRSTVDEELQEKLNANVNELCAFLIGYILCAYFAFKGKIDAEADIVSHIEKIELPTNYLLDATTLMKNKNISPHSLYLIYLSLFHNILPLKAKSATVVRLVT